MSLDVLLGHEGAREAVMHALALPASLGPLLVRYVALFRPAKRQLSFDRVARLLDELGKMIEAGSIERHSRTWPAPPDYWRMAIEEMLDRRDRLSLPLTSHGYLLEIIAGIGNRAEARVETKREADRAYAFGEVRSSNPAPGPLGHYVSIGGQTEPAGKEPAPMPAKTRESIDKLLRRNRGNT